MHLMKSGSIIWKAPLAVLFSTAALLYVLCGRFDDIFSQAIIGVCALLLLIPAFRYVRTVDGRSSRFLVRFSLLILGVSWVVEAFSLNTAILGSKYHYNSSHLASFGPAGVPIIVPLSWLLFGLLSASICSFLGEKSWLRFLRQKSRSGKLFIECLLNGTVFLAIDFAIEWHFSQVAGFWVWQNEKSAADLSVIPAGNFLLWFSFGFFIPIAERLTGARKRKDKKRSLFLRALPALGLLLLQIAGIFLNLSAAYFPGFIFCALFFSFLAIGLLSVLWLDRKRQAFRYFTQKHRGSIRARKKGLESDWRKPFILPEHILKSRKQAEAGPFIFERE